MNDTGGANVASAGRIGRWSGEFVDPAMETVFQQRVYHANARDARIALGVAAALMVLFFYTDFIYLRGTAGLWVLGGMRLGTALLAMVAVGLYYGRPSLIISGWLMTGLEMIAHAAYGLLVWYRPEDLAWHSATLMIMLMSLFILFPNRLPFMVASAVFGIAAMLTHVELAMALPAPRVVALALVLGLPAFIGYIAARRFAVSQRIAFLRIIGEQRVNDALQAEVQKRQVLEAELRRRAETDPLTGANNRRRFETVATEALSRASRLGQPVTLCLLDLDHFKRINDTHGHGVGDEVLIAVARRCRHSLRPNDVVARLGGEEFALLLPETGLPQADRLCRHLLAAIAAQPVPAGATEVHVTATAGLAEARPGESVSTLLERADKALYQGKAAGRDRVVTATA